MKSIKSPCLVPDASSQTTSRFTALSGISSPLLSSAALPVQRQVVQRPTRPRMLNISADGKPGCLTVESFRAALRELGELELMSGGDRMSAAEIASHVRGCDVFITGWNTTMLPAELAQNPGQLKYICGVTGTMKAHVPVELVDAGILLTNWGDAPAGPVAEGAMSLLLASLKDLHARVANVSRNGWRLANDRYGGSLEGLNVGVYGCGVIGRRFIELLRPFRSTIRVFDKYADAVPEGCQRVDSLEALFDASEAIVIHAGWTDETDKSVNADLLRRLPDHAIVVNTARGGIVDQEALFAELATGRLRAALDVLEPDHLAPDHPARHWENLILTSHQIEQLWPGSEHRMGTMHRYALDNLRRWIDGRPLRFVMDAERYRRST
ncbi:MAG: hydroxyacid dehydrogenase [Tepidisphaeraceae bacterium]